jgi:hypothetical protein
VGFNFSGFNIGLLVFFILCFGLAVLFRKKNDIFINVVFIATLVFFVLLCATRPLGSPDTVNYVYHYLNTRTVNLNSWELGYELLVLGSKALFGETYQLFFGLIALFNILVAVYCAKKLGYDIKKFVIIYIAVLGLACSYGTIRQGIAFSFIMLAYAFYANSKVGLKNRLLSVLFVSVAMLFHISAIFVLVMFAVSFIKIPSTNKFYYAVLLIGVVYLAIDLYGFLYPIVEYLGGKFSVPGLSYFKPIDRGIYPAYKLILHGGFLVWLVMNKDKNNPLEEKIYRMYIFMILFYIAFYQTFTPGRFMDFINIFLIVILAHFEKEQKGKYQQYVHLAVIVLCFMYFILQTVVVR